MKHKINTIGQKAILVFVVCITIAIFVSQVFFMYSKVPSSSMEPTVKEGEYVLIKRTHKIERGDIVAFYSNEFHTYMLKRCIGVSGDVVDIREGNIYLNGEYLQENYIKARSNESKTFVVPEGSFLFLGDNRADSFDAREWNTPFIAEEDVIGRLFMKVYPEIKIYE